MKILALSDEVVDLIYGPGLKQHFADVDLVLGCGDLPFYYLEFVVTVLNKPLYYVPGNHDHKEQYMSDGRIVHRAEGCFDLDGRVACEGGLLLAGVGGSLRYKPDGEHQYTQAEMRWRLNRLLPALLRNWLRCGRPLDMLITHAPPRGIHDAGDLAHTGFEAFLPFMRRFKPRYLLHGHSHVWSPAQVTHTRYAATDVINVYPYQVIQINHAPLR
ncbi:MAG: metallophosphoesterase [Chloroflexi bacterium]|nr:metallophosphoesterase [Chloroflexota bacterium]